MKNANWLDNLKIRASVGSAGHGPISDASAHPPIAPAGRVFTGDPRLVSSRL